MPIGRVRRPPASNGEFAADSPQEGGGFELPVPRAMQGRPKAIIDGFGCMPPSLDYLLLPLVEISEGGPRRNLGTEALSREEPEVRIHLPPAKSRANFRSLTWPMKPLRALIDRIGAFTSALLVPITVCLGVRLIQL